MCNKIDKTVGHFIKWSKPEKDQYCVVSLMESHRKKGRKKERNNVEITVEWWFVSCWWGGGGGWGSRLQRLMPLSQFERSRGAAN